MRKCGAKVLAETYRFFGINRQSDEIWAEMQSPTSSGAVCGRSANLRTSELVRHLIKNGLEAVAVRFLEPLSFLSKMNTFSEFFRLILNIRERDNSPLGHFVLFEEYDKASNTISIYDPTVKGLSVLSTEELLKLWQKWGESCEITGQVGILCTKRSKDEEKEKEEEKECTHCERRYTLRESGAILSNSKVKIFCPNCDRGRA